MMLAGVEEPIRFNQHIDYAYEDKIAPELFTHPKINRYVFLWGGVRDETNTRLSQLLRYLSESLQLPLTWFLGWENVTSGDYAFRSLVHTRQREKENLDMARNDEVVIAKKPVTQLPDNNYKPESHWIESGCLFLGNAPSASEWLSVNASLGKTSFLAGWSTVRLSPQLYNWAADNNFTVIYPRWDDIGRQALIIIGTVKLPVAEMEQQNLVNLVKEGSEAHRIWWMFY
jgi:hypothetical protein